MIKKLLAALVTVALGLGLAVTAALPASADPNTPPVGVWGTAVPWTSQNNHASWWNSYGGRDLTCVDGSATYGSVTDGGKTVTLNAFQSSWGLGDYYALLVVKAGSNDNNVITDPVAGTAYASPINNGGQQADVSHWYVCFGSRPHTDPQSVAVSGTPTNEVCDTDSGDVSPGSILLTFTGPSSGVTVTYRKVGDATYLPVGSNPLTGLAAGTYEFLVEPVSSAYTTTTPTFSVTIEPDDDDACDEVVPQSVAVSGTPTNEVCDTDSGDVSPGSILLTFTGPSSGVTVTYRKVGDATYLPVGSNPLTGLAAGTYEFLVEPVSSAYTTTTPTFSVTIEPDENAPCVEEVDVIGDPSIVQGCQFDEWVAYLTIASPSQPAGSVQYRVYFDDGSGTFPLDKGIWPEGTYYAGDDPGNPYEIPLGTTLKVVAEPTAGYSLNPGDVQEWEYTFEIGDICSVLGTVTTVVTFSQTCATGATYTLAIEGGLPGTVQWSINGGAPTTQLGTFAFPASSPLSISIVATPTPPAGLDPVADGSDGTLDGAMAVSKTYPDEATCDLTTLAMTGGDAAPLLTMAAMLGLLGVAMVRSARRLARRQEG